MKLYICKTLCLNWLCQSSIFYGDKQDRWVFILSISVIHVLRYGNCLNIILRYFQAIINDKVFLRLWVADRISFFLREKFEANMELITMPINITLDYVGIALCNLLLDKIQGKFTIYIWNINNIILEFLLLVAS